MKYTLIHKKMTPSGYWDNGLYYVSDNTVDIPKTMLKHAIITFYKDGVKGVNEKVSGININGGKYLVLGEVKRSATSS